MKIVMYHYVRPQAPGLPYFPYLALVDFERQLDHFAKSYGFVCRKAFEAWLAGGPAPEGVLLTFDDGLHDHVEFVLPALQRRGLFAIFYVSSAPLLEGRVLDVHKVHFALGRIGGARAVAWLEANAPDLLRLIDTKGALAAYAGQSSDAATKLVKRLFNWVLPADARMPALDGLLDYAFGGVPPSWRDIYLDEDRVRALAKAGMGVGPHSHAHSVPRLLTAEEQLRELALSCDFVESVGGSRGWGYCYPHGVPSAFTQATKAAVAQAGCPFAFAVEAADIEATLAACDRYALPRHNCNAFASGAASFGSARAFSDVSQRARSTAYEKQLRVRHAARSRTS